jgi:putative flippase GtrA
MKGEQDLQAMNLIKRSTSYITSHKAAFMKFVIGASIAFLTNIALTWLAVEWAGFHYLLSYTLIQIFVVTYGFIYQFFIVFRQRRISSTLFTKYILILTTVTALNIVTVKALTDGVGIHYLLSIFLSTGCFLIVKYVLYQRFVFTESRDTPHLPQV